MHFYKQHYVSPDSDFIQNSNNLRYQKELKEKIKKVNKRLNE